MYNTSCSSCCQGICTGDWTISIRSKRPPTGERSVQPAWQTQASNTSSCLSTVRVIRRRRRRRLNNDGSDAHHHRLARLSYASHVPHNASQRPTLTGRTSSQGARGSHSHITATLDIITQQNTTLTLAN